MASKDFCRPDPEELLRQIQAQEAHDARGRLKIFLGYAPSVGKSMRMFDEGRRRLKRGQDVVIGAIQTKGSEDLEPMIREFEVIPPLQRRTAAKPWTWRRFSDAPPTSASSTNWHATILRAAATPSLAGRGRTSRPWHQRSRRHQPAARLRTAGCGGAHHRPPRR